MWAAILTAGQWMAGSKAGRIAAAVAGALMGALLLRAKWRGDGAREEQAKRAVATVETLERVNDAGASFRADGAAGRLRDGTF